MARAQGGAAALLLFALTAACAPRGANAFVEGASLMMMPACAIAAVSLARAAPFLGAVFLPAPRCACGADDWPLAHASPCALPCPPLCRGADIFRRWGDKELLLTRGQSSDYTTECGRHGATPVRYNSENEMVRELLWSRNHQGPASLPGGPLFCAAVSASCLPSVSRSCASSASRSAATLFTSAAVSGSSARNA